MLGSRWTAGILGVWLIVAATLGMGAYANAWNDLLVGLVVGFASFPIGVESKLEGWAVGLSGLWLVAMSLIPALHAGSAQVWSDVAVGMVLTAAAFVPAGSGRLLHAHDHA